MRVVTVAQDTITPFVETIINVRAWRCLLLAGKRSFAAAHVANCLRVQPNLRDCCLLLLLFCVRVRTVYPLCSMYLQKLSSILGVVSKNPSNPTFDHWLFETIASLIWYAACLRASCVVRAAFLRGNSFLRWLTA